MAFILVEEDSAGGSYRLVNLNQVLTAEFADVKTSGYGRCVLHMSDKSKIELEGRDMTLALDTMGSSDGIQGFDRRSHQPR